MMRVKTTSRWKIGIEMKKERKLTTRVIKIERKMDSSERRGNKW
jgi:hypothetical protein